MKTRVLTIGSAMQDIFIEYACTDLLTLHSVTSPRSYVLLEEGSKLTVDNLSYKTGGGATNSAVSFAKLGLATTIFCKIGADDAATAIVQELKRNGIATDIVTTTQETHTGTSFIIPCPSGNRAVLVYRGANMTIQEDELPLGAITASDCVYITSLSGPTSPHLSVIAQHAKKHDKLVAANPGTSQLTAGPHLIAPALAYIDIFILNFYEASLLMETLNPAIPSDIKRYLHEISSHGPKTVVITNGADGVHVLHHNTYFYHSSIKTEVISTLGAGDAFGSCFVGQLLQKKSIEDAIRCGIINSASVLAHADCKAGLLDNKQLEQRLKNLDVNLLRTS